MNMQLGVWWSREKLWIYTAWRLQGSKLSGKEEHKAAILCSLDSQLMEHVRESCGDPKQCQWFRKAMRHLRQIKPGQKDKLVGWPPWRVLGKADMMVGPWDSTTGDSMSLELSLTQPAEGYSYTLRKVVSVHGGTLYRNGPQCSPSSNIHSRAVSSHNGPCQERLVKRSREGGTESLLPVAMWVSLKEDPPD